MIIKFSTKNNTYGWRHQLEVDSDKKQFKYGLFLFHYADINDMTKKQLDEIVKVLIDNEFEKMNLNEQTYTMKTNKSIK